MNADGSDPANLTQNAASDDIPAWSPDGAQIAFQSNRNDQYDIYAISVDGSKVIQITSASVDEQYPAWQPIR
jgi:Tol biopolymer transport system component